jgi:hypothetical protein
VAATAAGRQLTESHRLAQARLSASLQAILGPAWKLLDPTNLDGTFGDWLRIVMPAISAQHTQSATLAANYLKAFRLLELGDSGPVALADPLATEQVVTSLTVTGPATVKSAMTRGLAIDAAMLRGEVASTRAAMRLVSNGGRDTIVRTAETDRTANGWARVTSGKPCAFCAMLASRGAVYAGDFKSHDGCHCTAELRYRNESALPPGSERWADLWDQARSDPGDTVKVFRQLVEAG